MIEITLPVVALYCAPGIVALARGHHNTTAIIALNLLLGWTLLGWVAALVWSFTAITQTASAGDAAADAPATRVARVRFWMIVLAMIAALVYLQYW